MKKVLLFSGLCCLLLQTSCGVKHEGEETEIHYLVTQPIRMDTTVTREYVCQIHSISHIELRAQERGYLQEIFVDEGQAVRKGQLLFRIMPNLYQAEKMRAEAEVHVAEIEVRNTQALADKNVVSQNELAMAKAKLNKAKAELALAQTHLEFTEIRAPFDGIIDRFHVRLGSLVEEGDLLTNLSDNSKLWVYFNVPEAEYLNYKTDLQPDSMIKVKLQMANNRLFDYPGVVETIEADFDHETGNIAFRATFPNPKGLLRHGETGNILIDAEMHDALIIPQKATFEILEKKYAFIVGKDNRVRQVEIVVEAELPDLYVIKSGVKAGDKILLEGIRKVTNGQKIEFDFRKPEAVLDELQVYVE